MKAVRDGLHNGAVVWAFVNVIPRSANRSRLGVRACGCPARGPHPVVQIVDRNQEDIGRRLHLCPRCKGPCKSGPNCQRDERQSGSHDRQSISFFRDPFPELPAATGESRSGGQAFQYAGIRRERKHELPRYFLPHPNPIAISVDLHQSNFRAALNVQNSFGCRIFISVRQVQRHVFRLPLRRPHSGDRASRLGSQCVFPVRFQRNQCLSLNPGRTA